MPRTKEQLREVREQTLKKINNSATQLFVQKGFSATSVQQIADLAEISVGLLYKYYETKDELFSELVKTAMFGMEALIDYFNDLSNPKKTIIEFTETIYEDMVKDDLFSNLIMLMTQATFADITLITQNHISELDKRILESMSKLIIEGQERGEFVDGEPYEIASCFFGAVQGLAIMKITMGNNFLMPSPLVLQSIIITN